MESRFNVLVRVRPLIREDMDIQAKTSSKASAICTKCHEDGQHLYLVKPLYDDREFAFDTVLSPEASQQFAYEKAAEGIVKEVLQGYNGTIMAYGQTGSGKTYTVLGSRRALESGSSEEVGVTSRAVTQLFDFIEANIDEAQFQVHVSFLQIYMETLSDLLSSSHPTGGLQIREDPKTGIFITGLTQAIIRTPQELHTLIRDAARLRSSGATGMNKHSSRSHAIIQVVVEQRWLEGSEDEECRKRRMKKGQLTIVDLAGSERLSKSGSEGTRLTEAKNINKSIAALGNCISALASNASGSTAHVPFRDSKLTRLLTDSLGGNSKTCIYACVGPSLINFDETYSTLLFATRAMKIRTFVRINDKVDYRADTWASASLVERNAVLESQISSIRQEAESLRSQLAQRTPSPAVSQVFDASQNLSTITGFSQELGEDKNDARERELVSKFSHIIQHLQAELARKNIELEVLRGGRNSPLLDVAENTIPVRSQRWRSAGRR